MFLHVSFFPLQNQTLAIIFKVSELKKVALCLWNCILLKYGLLLRKKPLLLTCPSTISDHGNIAVINNVRAQSKPLNDINAMKNLSYLVRQAKHWTDRWKKGEHNSQAKATLPTVCCVVLDGRDKVKYRQAQWKWKCYGWSLGGGRGR